VHPAARRPIVEGVTRPIVEQLKSSSGLAYRVHTSPGSPDGLPVFVLVHGIGMSHRYLKRLHRELEASGTVMSFDLPGFGGTPKPRDRVTVEQYAHLIGRALDRAGARECVVVGHSMGCQFAVELARQRPSMVSSAVLIGPVVDSRRRSVLRQAVALARDSLTEPPSANFIVFTDYLRCGPRWYLTELPEMMAYPTEDRIADVSAPVLVIRGTRDPVAGSVWSAVLTARAPNGRMLELPGSHVVQQSATAQVAGAIRSFATDPLTVGGVP
jgi:pimeloyl-ACP methyl ester carboxylesterase